MLEQQWRHTSESAERHSPVSITSRALLWPIVIVCLFATPVFAQQYCATSSAIDSVPFFVGQSYLDILGRAPDSGGQSYHIRTVEGLNTSACNSPDPTMATGSCEWDSNAATALYMLESSESYHRNGDISDNTAFITVLYNLFLRRGPDQPGLNYYVSLLTSGTSRQTVLGMFIQSKEYRKRFACTINGTPQPSCNGAGSVDSVPSFVAQLYFDILGRAPDGAGLPWWTGITTTNQLSMCHNSSATAYSTCDRVLEAETVLNFFNSSEYLGSNPPIDNNGDFVTALYQRLLQKQPDAVGQQFYTSYLDGTGDRVGTIESFITSNAYRNRFSCYAGTPDKMNFGINGHPFDSSLLTYSNSVGIDYVTQTTLIQGAGLKWYRVNIGVDPYVNDFGNMDLMLAAAQANGVTLLPDILPTVDRVNDSLDTIYAKSFAAAFAIVSRYKSSIHVWNLSNEEDVYSLYAPGDPWKGGYWPYGSPTGELTTDFYPPRLAISEAVIRGLADGARAADPNCLRLIDFAWLHTGMIDSFEADQVPYDILGIHWYSNADLQTYPAMGEITCPGQPLPCTPPLIHFNVLDRVHMLTNGKPLWITETNYRPVLGTDVNLDMTLEDDYLSLVLPLYVGSPSVYPFQVVLVYELLDEPDIEYKGPTFGEMGLYQTALSSDGHVSLGAAKPAYNTVVKNVN